MAEATVLRRTQLDAEREAIKARIAQFRNRLTEDRSAVAEEARRLVGPQSSLAEHPGVLMAGSAAVGFGLGLAPAKLPHPDLAPPAVLSDAAAKAAKGVLAGLKLELAVVARDFVAGVVGASEGGDRLNAGLSHHKE